MKEKITVIKENISFAELPKKIKDTFITNEAEAILISFDEGVHTIQTALLDAKKYYEEWSDCKYVLYHSSIHGECANEVGNESWR